MRTSQKTAKARRGAPPRGGSTAGSARKGTGAEGNRPARTSVHAGRFSRLLAVPASLMGPRLLFTFAIVALCILGLVMVYSASSITAYNEFHNASYYFDRQAFFLVLGGILCVALAKIPYRFWANPVVFVALWVISCALLAITAFGGGVSALGAERSLMIAGFALQPSEFAKASVLLALAALIGLFREGELEFKEFATIAIIALVVPIALMYKQPDLGTALILAAGALAMLVLAGARLSWVAVIIALLGVYVVVVCVSQPYHLDRIRVLFDPWSDPQGDGYHSIQSLYAFGSGGIFGTGLGLSRQKYLYLPYAHTDFIFSVIGEELGLVGTLSVVALFALFAYAGLRIARSAPDFFGCLVAGSMTAMIAFQACVNMGQACGIVPVTGKALPFLSYGGSSLVATLIMCGIVLSVSIHSKVGAANERRRDDLRVYEGGRGRRDTGGPTRPKSAPGTGRPLPGERAQRRRERRQPSRVAARSAPHGSARVISIHEPVTHAARGEFRYGQSVYARRHGAPGTRR